MFSNISLHRLVFWTYFLTQSAQKSKTETVRKKNSIFENGIQKRHTWAHSRAEIFQFQHLTHFSELGWPNVQVALSPSQPALSPKRGSKHIKSIIKQKSDEINTLMPYRPFRLSASQISVPMTWSFPSSYCQFSLALTFKDWKTTTREHKRGGTPEYVSGGTQH